MAFWISMQSQRYEADNEKICCLKGSDVLMKLKVIYVFFSTTPPNMWFVHSEMVHLSNKSTREVFKCDVSVETHTYRVDVIRFALQAVCGYNSALRTYIGRLSLELRVITGNDVTKGPGLKFGILLVIRWSEWSHAGKSSLSYHNHLALYQHLRPRFKRYLGGLFWFFLSLRQKNLW